MPKNLLIVESPAKAKTIEKYLGKDFKVKSSYGHIRDLEKGKKGIDIEKFQPNYVVSPEKTRIVKELKTAMKSVDEVWLATDEDREGEAISWHLCEVLGLDPATTKRIVFREITKGAIQSAITTPRLVDINLVNAQQARRVLDRLVGFELSEVLWRKVKHSLSAGRVQSVAVKLIAEREREIQKFTSAPFYKIQADFTVKNDNGKNVILKSEMSDRISTLADTEDFVAKCAGAKYSITDIKVKPLKRNPAAPFTTSTLQQDASRKMGFAVNRTMSNAQRLYEQGFITYMRTDSTSLSGEALGAAADVIKANYGEKYLNTRQFKTKKKDAQEAHEAIRPTFIDREVVTSDRDQQRLYDLIRKRTLASQMASAEIEKTTVDIGFSTIKDASLKAEGEVLKFDGFLKVYMEGKDEDGDSEAKGILPPLKISQILDLDHLKGLERFTRPPSRYTEASLVKKLEELGIGRPSTYAPTITKIMEAKRGYVTKESREGTPRDYYVIILKNDSVSKTKESEMTGATSNRLYASDLGILVTDFLDEHFSDIMQYNFTAKIEDDFDKIADGDKEWKAMISGFYGGFHANVEKTMEEAARAKGRRELGIDPESGYKVLVQMTRYGPVVQIGDREEVKEDEKPRFASLRRGQSMETVTYEEAMELFKLPKTIGNYEDKEVIIGMGRFGPYVKFDEKFVSLPRGRDPMEVELDEAIGLIEQKRKEDAPVGSYKGTSYTKGKGRFGPFLKYGDLFVNVPKRYDFDNLSQEDAHELIEAKVQKEANRYIHQWPKEKIAVENGRWGPFIRLKKKSIPIPKDKDGNRMTPEQAKELSLEAVKKIIKASGKE
ncbi:MAG: type I DNA topoisomerase [Saprospiraceae bacterium]